jgi:hypothetical protein
MENAVKKKTNSCKDITAVICTWNRETRMRRKGLKNGAEPLGREKKDDTVCPEKDHEKQCCESGSVGD